MTSCTPGSTNPNCPAASQPSQLPVTTSSPNLFPTPLKARLPPAAKRPRKSRLP